MKKIQIALVSKETLPVFYMINELLPDEVYLIGTDQSRDSVDRIAKAVAGIKDKPIACHCLRTEANDIRDCMRQCDNVHAENGDGCEYCYNLTCGTKLMAIGALICAQKHKAAAVYTDFQSYIDFEEFNPHPMTRLLDIDTIMALQGQKIKDREVYRYDAERTKCANKVRDFQRANRKLFHAMIRFYNDNYNRLPSEYDNRNFYAEEVNGELTIFNNDKVVFHSDYPEARKMFFEGRWWETLVANAVSKWSDGRYEIWTSVRFEPKDKRSSNDKNEIDVLVNIGNALLFIECKSGAFGQDNIYKLSSVYKTYGSYKSQSVIISYWSGAIRPDLEEKAKEENVQLFAPDWSMNNMSRKLDEIVKSTKA